MDVPFLNLHAQYSSIKGEIDVAIQKVIDASSFALGPAVSTFEEAFAEYCGVKHCVGVGSGTAALTLLFRAHNIGPGDEVITATNSFFASAEAISLVGAKAVLIDAREETANMDREKLEATITEHTKAILPVHLYGQCADIDAIKEVAKKNNLLVLEDAAQAHGALYNGKRAGSLADGAAFSFYPGKNLGAYGEAGAVVTNDGTIAERVRMLRDHGMKQKYHHSAIGYNERMDGIQGAVLGVKLKHIDNWNNKRREHAAKYREKLKEVNSLQFFDTLSDCEHVYHLFVIRTLKRDALQEHLKEKGIASGIHYPIPIHLQKAYNQRGWSEGDFPVAEKLAKEILSLPMFPELTEVQIDAICSSISNFMNV